MTATGHDNYEIENETEVNDNEDHDDGVIFQVDDDGTFNKTAITTITTTIRAIIVLQQVSLDTTTPHQLLRPLLYELELLALALSLSVVLMVTYS